MPKRVFPWEDGRMAIGGAKWDLESGKELAVYSNHLGLVEAVACNDTGTRVVTAGKDKEVHLLDGNTFENLHIFQGHTAAINFVAISPDARWAASTSDDYTTRIWIWNLKRPQEL